jgi:heterodisulfide reductase subunit C
MQICPNAVKPAVLIEYMRREMLRRGRVSLRTVRRYRKLYECFQRVRWHAADYCVDNRLDTLEDGRWQQWLETPLPECSAIYPGHSGNGLAAAASEAQMAACFTCGECSSACPVAAGRDVFDPRTLFRMVNLGLTEALIASPSIWLCISCRRCTEACSQNVDGEKMIATLRKMALERGAVDGGYPHRLEQADRVIYQRFLDEIDALFGFSGHRRLETDSYCLPKRHTPACTGAVALR